MNLNTRIAANILDGGGVVSLPTDTIQGLSCLPLDHSLIRLIELKQRSTNKGLILIASDIKYVEAYVEDIKLLKQIKATNMPTTYIIKANKNTPSLLLGGYDTVAIRLTNNQLIKDLCKITNSALVSTSANISGQKIAQSVLKLRVYFKDQLDYIIAPVKTDANPSAIINLHTGERLR
ncbi:TsaC protein (YrdC domain) required for threonylcarbamoyladenosine t(6)A37 modification in tRNA [Bathymodiolus heckerae thiotrophic gill symbiont]|uniref:L-threonylcarbamoyladenylate synthase n=1 Tax=Bathymodiolus heckerae thiotrophic gill symbiont TaxID=1052212 RepID=UPI0010B5411A|nr:L-threonylcarbamoyladenylate synthase [Bathymodiolus heckerae thiotrophic gill symbiont]CAC9596170.1 Threonylcarbamoyl-AMP synthase (EC 2.7.7.87) [uncultured Gammaproteobacteria bacterium]SHN92355.1 TsaC protein (YrdC domain) required for threonylcarbamoyladenosine t(6)A37 modification in tRNA [Bathymodiolus heckerae thiotrophic gill symbiont]